MQNITKRCPETIGVDILGLADNLLLSGDNWKSIAPHVLVDIGGRCRIRTHVSGSEGRKDIQTTLIARSLSDRQLLLEEVC